MVVEGGVQSGRAAGLMGDGHDYIKLKSAQRDQKFDGCVEDIFLVDILATTLS